jgi:hypothetical protein
MKIYAVISSGGSYDTYFERIEKCFTNWEAANEFAKQFDKSREFEQIIPDDIWDAAEDFADDTWNKELQDFCRKHDIPGTTEFEKRTEDQRVLLQKRIDELNSREHDNMLKYLEETYPGKYKMEDIIETENYFDTLYKEYHPSKIKEIELVVNEGDLVK